LNLNLIPRNWKPRMFLARKPSNENVDNVAKGGPSYLSELPRRTCRACFVVVTMESKSILKRYWVRTSRCHVGSWCIWRKMDEDCAYFSDLDYIRPGLCLELESSVDSLSFICLIWNKGSCIVVLLLLSKNQKKKKIQYKGREIIDQQYIKLEDLVKSY